MEVSDIEPSSSSAIVHGVVIGEVSRVLFLLVAVTLFNHFPVPSSTILLSSSPQPFLSLHPRAKEYRVSNLHHFILRGMVDRTSQIWIVSNFHHSFLVAWLTVPAKYGASVHDANYFCITKHLYGSIRKFIVFVCT